MIKILRLPSSLIFMMLFGSVAILALPSATHAATTNLLAQTTPETAPTTTVTVTPELAKAWQGSYRLPAISLVRSQPPSFINLMYGYIGRRLIVDATNPSHTYYYNPGAIYDWINNTLGKTIDVPAQEPKLNITDGRVVDFQPPQVGQTLNVYQSALNVIAALEEGKNMATLAIDSASPQTSLGELNNLGIKELVSRGESNFGNSPSNRKHNIAIGVDKMKGVIIAPGDEFSFNKYLGPVEAAEGFLPELVIKGGQGTVPELGGGLCQVSSTTFRAAMQAGLPITARRNHSYAVSYYAPQGTDATIYPGVQDLKFINDTPGSIMIWPYFGPKNSLFFDFYGTKDDRQVTLQNPVVFDRKPDGSMKASWTRTIIKNGASASHTFNSDYQSPALFHKTEQFVPNPAAPATGTPAGSTPPPSPNGTITPATPTVNPSPL